MMRLQNRKILAAVVAALLLIPAALSIAADGPSVSVTADRLDYNGKTQVATATGECRHRSGPSDDDRQQSSL